MSRSAVSLLNETSGLVNTPESVEESLESWRAHAGLGIKF